LETFVKEMGSDVGESKAAGQKSSLPDRVEEVEEQL
jgi:hypothetical protein